MKTLSTYISESISTRDLENATNLIKEWIKSSLDDYKRYQELYSTVYDTIGGLAEKLRDSQGLKITTKEDIATYEKACDDLVKKGFLVRKYNFVIVADALKELKLTEEDIILDAIRDEVLTDQSYHRNCGLTPKEYKEYCEKYLKKSIKDAGKN